MVYSESACKTTPETTNIYKKYSFLNLYIFYTSVIHVRHTTLDIQFQTPKNFFYIRVAITNNSVAITSKNKLYYFSRVICEKFVSFTSTNFRYIDSCNGCQKLY